MGIMYCITAIFWLQVGFGFAIITEYAIEMKGIDINCVSLLVCYCILLYFKQCSFFVIFYTHCEEVVSQPHPQLVFPYAGTYQGVWLDPQYLNFCSGSHLYFCFSEHFSFCTSFPLYGCDFTASKFLFSLRISKILVGSLCTSILLTHTRTSFLFTEPVSFIAVHLLITSYFHHLNH